MSPFIGKIVLEIGKSVGKAVLAGIGLELAKVASDHVRRRLGPRDAKKPLTPEEQLAEVKAENEALKAELARVKASAAAPTPGPDDEREGA